MQYINRSAIVVKYKTPFMEWRNSLYIGSSLNKVPSDSNNLDSFNQENLVYLLEEHDDNYHLESLLKQRYISIFQDVLKGWCKDTSRWPDELSWNLFNSFFEINAHSRVKDLESIPLKHSLFP